MSLYTSQTYKHRQAVGPVQLEIVPGKGLGWRATRDITVGELLLVSLPIAVLYGTPGEAPSNDELAEALRQAWPRLSVLERRWLLLLGDCCAATSGAVPPLLLQPPAAVARQQPGGGGGDVAPTTAAAQDGQPASESTAATTAEVPATSARPDGALEDLFLLLHRARSLLAEAQKVQTATELVTAPPPPPPQQQQQPTASRPKSAAAAAAASTSSPSASAAAASSNPPALPLPPALFGISPSISSIHPPTATPTAATYGGGGGGSGGVVADLVRRYSYSEPYEDPVLEELLEVPPVSCVGLWPEVALLNHSCCPNTALLVVGGVAYARAGRAVMEGEELTVSYLGTDVAPDRGLLRRINGELVTELEAAAHATLTAASRPRQQQAALLARMEGLLGQVEDSCTFLELPPRGRLVILASVYGLVRLICDLAELSQQTTPERRLQLQQLAAEVLEAVAPGSDSHVTAAVKAAGVARRAHGADSAAARRAELAAGSAHLARYGRELLSEPALLRRLVATRRRLVTGSDLAASMGVLAWLEQAGPG
ncbi:hypothetical protein VOLCADRAFT_89688 [Volvox carteri f. nagariensis]|uniref:SET domain-containing protein n=1 Tax=Volvox carteri f. nagariensis TaxID=3068 RepID=D8TRT9_VOLCA|nr:uncharacterized protein VOLCADRAFT_89688 [Volvox carteri f. nagariensis]EFJ49703.1 hypothetical protein VOLCADRAFT_89688 [Volvox carteri f. nagariensis]|eukprot:XP_002949210.1 hypothetical protein VOLCADRAFT_89688 [Volvox carteri f. nagariensis]